MSKDRVIEYHIARLQDRRKSIRLDAIEQLRLLEAVEVLPELEQVYHNDPDETVRRQAKIVGKFLYDLSVNK